MKLSKTAIFALFFVMFALYSIQNTYAQDNFQSASNSPIQFDDIYFQEWQAGKQAKSIGFNIFLPNVKTNKNIKLKEVYFRDLKAKLYKSSNQYVATLEKTQKSSAFQNHEKSQNHRFHLRDTECVIAYVDNGETKYMKASVFDERPKTYYKNSPPKIYKKMQSSSLANSETED